MRLFRLLYLHRQLEQKQIAEQAMLPPKVILLAHSCPCFRAVSACKRAAYITNSRLLDLYNCQLHAVGQLQQRTLPKPALYVDTAFMHDVLDHLCWQSRDMIVESLKSDISCVSQHAEMLSWPQQQAKPAGLHQHHLGYCMWLQKATSKYLLLLHNDCLIMSSKDTDGMHVYPEHVL